MSTKLSRRARRAYNRRRRSARRDQVLQRDQARLLLTVAVAAQFAPAGLTLAEQLRNPTPSGVAIVAAETVEPESVASEPTATCNWTVHPIGHEPAGIPLPPYPRRTFEEYCRTGTAPTVCAPPAYKIKMPSLA